VVGSAVLADADRLFVCFFARAEQADETWLTPFKNAITTEWDITNIHVNKNNMDGVKKDIVSIFRSCRFFSHTLRGTEV
jgi:hypothetical protein